MKALREEERYSISDPRESLIEHEPTRPLQKRFLVRAEPSPEDIIWIGADNLRRRLEYAARILENSIEISNETRGGVPVVRGTRMPVSRVLAELADNVRIEEFGEDYEIDVAKLKELLQGLSVYLDRPLRK